MWQGPVGWDTACAMKWRFVCEADGRGGRSRGEKKKVAAEGRMQDEIRSVLSGTGSAAPAADTFRAAAARLTVQSASSLAAAQYHMPFAGRMLAPPYGRSCSAGALRTQSAQRAGMRSAITTASACCRSSTCTAQVAAASPQVSNRAVLPGAGGGHPVDSRPCYWAGAVGEWAGVRHARCACCGRWVGGQLPW